MRAKLKKKTRHLIITRKNFFGCAKNVRNRRSSLRACDSAKTKNQKLYFFSTKTNSFLKFTVDLRIGALEDFGLGSNDTNLPERHRLHV